MAMLHVHDLDDLNENNHHYTIFHPQFFGLALLLEPRVFFQYEHFPFRNCPDCEAQIDNDIHDQNDEQDCRQHSEGWTVQ